MYSIIATWYLKPGEEAEGIAALKQLAQDVKQEEDTWGYLIHTGGENSAPPCSDGTVVFIEIYKNFQAFLDHVSGPIFTAFKKDHGQLFQPIPGSDSPFFLVENIDRIGGFLRPQAGS